VETSPLDKLRNGYTSTDLDGRAGTINYEVLGKDKHSVAIREIQDKPSLLDDVGEFSEFTVIQFDGQDSYWLYTQIGGIREYFKRIR